MKVAILYDAGSDEWSPQDVAAVVGNVHEVRDVLRRRGHEVELLPVRLGDFRWLSRLRRADLVFNLCEGINGHAKYEDLVVGTLELAGVPFTGCRTWPTTVCHRKHVANTLLAAAGLPVPAFALAQANKTPADFPLPAIVKPSAEDASVGIDNGAVCTSKRALKKRVALMLEQFEEVLVK
jgi:D-alanine-D-alanine ligase